MKKSFIIWSMVLFLVIVSSVSAEQIIVNTSVTLSADNDTLHVITSFGNKDYSIANDLQNNSQIYSFQFVSDIECSQESLSNDLATYTATVVNACNITTERLQTCDIIYNTNTEISGENLLLKHNQTIYEQIQPQYENCESVRSTQEATIKDLIEKADGYDKAKSDLFLYAIIGFFAGLGAMWWYYSHGKQSRSSSNPPSAQTGYGVDVNANAFPKEYDKDPRGIVEEEITPNIPPAVKHK